LVSETPNDTLFQISLRALDDEAFRNALQRFCKAHSIADIQDPNLQLKGRHQEHLQEFRAQIAERFPEEAAG
jgi:hypothetical protein